MRLEDITPVILTYNEEPNIGRTLRALAWARDIVVLDSGSTDRTVAIAEQFPQVRLFTRPFDLLKNQWNHALAETGIATEWVLTFDADYVMSEAGRHEIAALAPDDAVGGYRAPFRLCIHGHPLRRSLYPARTVLYRRARGIHEQDGHAQKLVVHGEIRDLVTPLHHDDRKPISRWLVEQDRYARLERDKLAAMDPALLALPDRIRRRGFLAPLLILLYCLFRKGMIFEGWAGWLYSYQRVTAELVLSLYLIDDKLRGPPSGQEP